MLTHTARLLFAALAIGTTASVSFAGPPKGFYPVPSSSGFRPAPNTYPGPTGFPGRQVGFPGRLVAQPTLPPPSILVAPPSHHHHHHYEVRYRTCDHEPWRCAGHFDCRHDADHAAHHYRHHGYEVIVLCTH